LTLIASWIVFVFVTVSIHFRVLAERAYDAYYSLADTNLQIRTYVYDVIRSTIPRMDLDQVFSSKTGISDTIFSRLQSVMKRYGYEVVSTLVARITPNELVKVSMNEINASKRSKEAVPHRAEAGK
jgi:regulator of protease activity HflC (stomatin/prohibitin superfamily)